MAPLTANLDLLLYSAGSLCFLAGTVVVGLKRAGVL